MLPVSLTVLKSQIKTVLSKRVYRDIRTKNKNCLFKFKLLKNCFQQYKQIPVNQIIYTFLQKYQMFQGSLWGTSLFSVIVKKLVCLMMIMISMSCFIVWLTKKKDWKILTPNRNMYLLSSQNPKYAVSIESKLLERKASIKPNTSITPRCLHP